MEQDSLDSGGKDERGLGAGESLADSQAFWRFCLRRGPGLILCRRALGSWRAAGMWSPSPRHLPAVLVPARGALAPAAGPAAAGRASA